MIQSPTQRNQKGMASIIVVMMLLIIISLVSLGFSKLIDRATRQALGNNQASAAYFAARSGINDVAAWLRANPQWPLPTQCDSWLSGSQPFAGGKGQLSGNDNTRYTCILVDKSPDDLVYPSVPAYNSQVALVSSSKSIDSLMISWQASDRSQKNFVASGHTLYNETEWGRQKYTPLLRVSLYTIQDNNKFDSGTNYFLYPNQGGTSLTTFSDSSGDGKLNSVGCRQDRGQQTTTFDGSADYDCNVVINHLGSKRYMVKLTPMYANADIKIKGNDNHNKALSFDGNQYVVDITAKSGNAVKRLQARVEAPAAADHVILPGDDSFPDYAIRGANTICKRLLVDNVGKSVSVDSAYCNLSLSPPASSTYRLTVTLRRASDQDYVSGDGIDCGKASAGHNTCTKNYSGGTIVHLQAHAPTIRNYDNSWDGCDDFNNNTGICTVTMDDNKRVDAVIKRCASATVC